MNEEFCGQITLSYVKCSGDAGGYLISEEPIRSFLANEPTRCINVWLKKSFNSLPPLGFSLRGPAKIDPGELTADPSNLSQNYLVCVFNDPAMPEWCFAGAHRGDRLRVRFEGSGGQYTAQFRLNQLPPTHPYDVRTSAPIYFVIRVNEPNDVAVLTEDETVHCLATGSQPYNRVAIWKPKEVVGAKAGKEATRLSNLSNSPNSAAGRASTSQLEPQVRAPARPPVNPAPTNDLMKRAVFPECVVCTEVPVELLNFPCQHATSCGDCFKMVSGSVASAAELKCPLCRKKVAHTRKIVEASDVCAFDGCTVMDAAAMPCGCVVGCFAKASALNGFCHRGELPPLCPTCNRDVAAFYQVYFP